MCNNLHINVGCPDSYKPSGHKKVFKPQSYLRAFNLLKDLLVFTFSWAKLKLFPSSCTLFILAKKPNSGNESTCHVTRSCEKSREIFANNNNWQIVRSTKGYEQHSLCQPPDPQYYEFTLVIRQPTISPTHLSLKKFFTTTRERSEQRFTFFCRLEILDFKLSEDDDPDLAWRETLIKMDEVIMTKWKRTMRNAWWRP